MKKTGYSEKCFYSQLKRARVYRGYKTQSALCTKLGVSRQVYNLWELNRRKPGLNHIVKIANILQMGTCFFFVPDGEPRAYDLKVPEKVPAQPDVENFPGKLMKR